MCNSPKRHRYTSLSWFRFPCRWRWCPLAGSSQSSRCQTYTFHRSCSVLQPDGSAAFVIKIYKEVVRVFHNLFAILSLSHPCLGDDLGAVQRVVVDRTAVCLEGSDAIHSEDSTRICFVYNSVMESSLRIFQITATSFYNVPTRYLLVRCLWCFSTAL